MRTTPISSIHHRVMEILKLTQTEPKSEEVDYFTHGTSESFEFKRNFFYLLLPAKIKRKGNTRELIGMIPTMLHSIISIGY